MKILNDSSAYSTSLDFYTLFITVVCTLVTLGIIIAIAYFCYKYHASRVTNDVKALTNRKLEVIWLTLTLAIFMLFFFWATSLFYEKAHPQKADYEVFVHAKQWMWKFHHPNGFTEINNLHLPRDKKIHFVMISEDVIHSFYLPEFRLKQDVLPEMYTIMGIHPLKNGDYQLFCAEYCGTDHALMGGKLTVVEPDEYLRITQQEKNQGASGRDLFVKHDCLTCHHAGSDLAPSLVGINRSDSDVRRSILYPKAGKVKDFKAQMPSYQGAMNEKELHTLIQYIKSMRKIDEKLL